MVNDLEKIVVELNNMDDDVLLNYIYNNKNILYKLIETRNQKISKKLDNACKNLKQKILDNIIEQSKSCDVYVIGHKNPDADSIFSSYLLSNILKKLSIKSHFCILDRDYNYSYNDEKLIKDFLKEKPEVISNIDNKKFILVDHNNLEGLNKDNVIGAIDHHKISNEVDNILEIEYTSTGLLIYDLFKNVYEFSKEEKELIALTVMADSEYLCSSRFTDKDKKLYDELNIDLDVKKLQKEYFKTTDFYKSIEDNIKSNYKEYNIDNEKVRRVLIYSYNNDFNKYFEEYKNYMKEQYLLIWCDYELNKTTVYFNDKIYEFDYIISSTYLILEKIKNKHKVNI